MSQHPVVPDAAPPGATTFAIDRRRALRRLGLAAGTAYLAPTLLSLSPARAEDDGPSQPKPPKPSKPCKKDCD